MDLQLQTAQKIIELERRVETAAVPEKSIDLIGPFLALPGLVGFWPMSSVQRSTGNAYDLSGQGRTLTYNGNPTYNYTGLAPYIDLDGTGDYLDRADEADLDVLGTETIFNSAIRGLTLGGWYWLDALPGAAAFAGLMSKWTGAGNQRAYVLLYNGNASTIQFQVSSDGTNTHTNAASTATIAAEGWYFVVGKLDPSVGGDIFVNMVKDTDAATPPASIFNSNAALQIGAFGAGSNLLDGRVSLNFLCAAMLSDAQISNLYQQTRGAFGV